MSVDAALQNKKRENIQLRASHLQRNRQKTNGQLESSPAKKRSKVSADGHKQKDVHQAARAIFQSSFDREGKETHLHKRLEKLPWNHSLPPDSARAGKDKQNGDKAREKVRRHTDDNKQASQAFLQLEQVRSLQRQERVRGSFEKNVQMLVRPSMGRREERARFQARFSSVFQLHQAPALPNVQRILL